MCPRDRKFEATTVVLVLLAFLILAPDVLSKATTVNIATDTTDPNNLADTEPSIAVNPLDPDEIVVVSFSESWGPNANAPLWRSTDGGLTWAKAFVIPQPAAGLPGPGDQKVVFDDSGNLLIAELGIGAVPRCFIFRQTGGPNAPLVAGAAYGDDQPHLEVERVDTDPCFDTVYSPWLNFGVAPARSMVSNSANAGVAMANVAAGNNLNFPNRTTRIAVDPEGRVYIVYKTREGAAGGGFENVHFRVNRSDDCGATWTALGAAGVSVHGTAQVQTLFTNTYGNPAKGKVARARSSDAWIAVDPGDGDVYVTYVRQDADGIAQIFLARSVDQGATWNSTQISNSPNHAGFPEVAVAENGTVGVLYIDFDDSGASTIFRHRFARSFDNGVAWDDQVLQSMDPGPLANAASGFLWGDYEGLTAHGNMFYGVFTGASTGRSTAQLDPIFFKETALPFAIDVCDCRPWKFVHPVLEPGLIKLKCLFRECLIVDPIPQNCLVKFDCPGCEPRALCPPFYHLFLDGLDGAWNVGLFHAEGTPAPYREFRAKGATVISFRPDERHYVDGSIGDYFLAFQLGSKGRPGVEYPVKVRLVRSDNPYEPR